MVMLSTMEKQNSRDSLRSFTEKKRMKRRKNLIDIIIDTPRLSLRRIEFRDFGQICDILQDIEIMYAWEHAFSDQEVDDWIEKNRQSYQRHGYGYWAVIEKGSDGLIGLCGLIAEQAEGQEYVGIGYIFNRKYWGKGYALESALACMNYAFDVLNLKEVTAQIRPDNFPSIKVAEKLNMKVKKNFMKTYKGKDLLHALYSRRRETKQ